MAEHGEQENDADVKIMICIDGSQQAEDAFKFYVDYFHKPENKVIFMHIAHLAVSPHIYTGGLGVVMPTVPTQPEIDKEKKKIKDLKTKLENMCNELGVQKPDFIALLGGEQSHGATIVEAARKRNVDTIVCGSRGLGSIRRTILGSVSDYVLHHSHVPTLICPPKK